MVSDFINNLLLDCFDCVSAEKNISVSDEYRYTLVTLEFRDVDGRGYKVSSSYAVNLGGKISQEESIKVAYQYIVDGKTISRDRILSFFPSEVTEELLDAVNDINTLFEEVDLKNKRVYL